MTLPANPVRRLTFQAGSSLLAATTSVLLGVYQATLEMEIEGEEHLLLLNARGQNYILSVWHTFVDAAVFFFHSRGICIYSDHPRNREYERSWTHFTREIGIKALRGMGFDVLDASRGKQSAGLVQFIKIIRNGIPALVAPDGPHGPIYRAKPGTMYIASKTRSVVVPVGFGFSRHVIGPNWDDFSLPLPFSRVAVTIGRPLEVGGNLGDQEMQQATERLEAELDHLSFRANEMIFG